MSTCSFLFCKMGIMIELFCISWGSWLTVTETNWLNYAEKEYIGKISCSSQNHWGWWRMRCVKCAGLSFTMSLLALSQPDLGYYNYPHHWIISLYLCIFVFLCTDSKFQVRPSNWLNLGFMPWLFLGCQIVDRPLAKLTFQSVRWALLPPILKIKYFTQIGWEFRNRTKNKCSPHYLIGLWTFNGMICVKCLGQCSHIVRIQ